MPKCKIIFWPLRPAVSFGLLLSPILCSTENSMFTGAPEARVLNTDPDYTSRPFIAVLRPDSLALNVTRGKYK